MGHPVVSDTVVSNEIIVGVRGDWVIGSQNDKIFCTLEDSKVG